MFWKQWLHCLEYRVNWLRLYSYQCRWLLDACAHHLNEMLRLFLPEAVVLQVPWVVVVVPMVSCCT